MTHAAFMAVGSQLLFGLLASDTVRDPAHGAAVYPSEAAFTAAFSYVSAMCLACLLVLLALPGRRATARVRPLDGPVEQRG